jgi:Carbohydrate esterase, sialic acid-specific acetylesterase
MSTAAILKFPVLWIVSLSLFSCSRTIAPGRTAYFPTNKIKVETIPPREKTWVFIMAGQSNMAGRGLVEPADTIPHPRIYSIDSNGYLIIAKEPLHFYEPSLTGLDCGLSFARKILEKAPADIAILMIPVAVGGSSISQWLGDSIHRGVNLYSNYLEKLAIAKKYGTLKGILWHQGESDTNERGIASYKERLHQLFSRFRADAGFTTLPILIGELGSYSENQSNWNLLNNAIRSYSSTDSNSAVIPTGDFDHKGDHLHFDSKGQREMGIRFAMAWWQYFYHP